MTSTFKAGDKVEHRTWGAGEIAFGPYLRDGSMDNYLMREASSGEHRFVEAEGLSPAAKFKVGDKTRGVVSGTLYIIEGGPYFDSLEWYAVKYPNGTTKRLDANRMTLVESAEPKVGDKVKVVAGEGISSYIGQVVTLTEVGASSRYGSYGFRGRYGGTCYAREVERVEEASADTYEYGGVTYDLSAKYRDRDGDVWEFARFGGEVVAAIGRKPVDKYDGDAFSVAAGYGPLTRV
jgi:hypothetical protein